MIWRAVKFLAGPEAGDPLLYMHLDNFAGLHMSYAHMCLGFQFISVGVCTYINSLFMLLDKLSNFLGVIILRLQLDAPHRHSQLSAFVHQRS